MGFGAKLTRAARRLGNPVVVGIDPRMESLPPGFLGNDDGTLSGRAETFRAFGREVVDVVADLVPAVKFQAAFYEAFGPPGLAALGDSLAYARSKGLLVILDGKRNDIGSTAEAYAQAYLGDGEEEPWAADALTINAYLGVDGVEPFCRAAGAAGKGLFALVRTSNPSARDVQDLIADDRPVYRHVAEAVVRWGSAHRDESGYSLLGAVVGATYPDQLAELRDAMPGVVFLVPGYGAQGGTAADVAHAFYPDGLGAVVNNSRGLTFAYLRKDFAGMEWQKSVEVATRAMIEDLATNTPAGRLRG